MHDQVMNEFVLDTGTKSGTDWVVTFPTKKFYINIGTGNAPKLFQRNFNKTAGSCDDVSLGHFRPRRVHGPDVVLAAPALADQRAVLGSERLTFNNSHLLGSVNETNIPTAFQNGWLNLGFPTGIRRRRTRTCCVNVAVARWSPAIGGGSTSGSSVTYFGLPVIGFAVQDFVNGTLSSTTGPAAFIQSSYGGNFVQKTTTIVQ